MPACCVLECQNRTERGFRMFNMPQGERNAERRDAWIKNIKRDNLPVNPFVCEAHFEKDQFESNREDGKRPLKGSAIPTIFNEKRPMYIIPLEPMDIIPLETEYEKPDKESDALEGVRRSRRKRKPVKFEEYHSEVEHENETEGDLSSEEVEEKNPIQKIDLIRCRTCLTTAPRLSAHILRKLLLGKTIRQIILICVPQLENSLLSDEYVCDKCYRFLVKLMLFIDSCLDTEEKLLVGSISLEVNSDDVAGAVINNKHVYPTKILKKRGRKRKQDLSAPKFDEDDDDYSPESKPPLSGASDKIPKKRGRKRKIDVKEEVLDEEGNEKKKIEDTETVLIASKSDEDDDDDYIPESQPPLSASDKIPKKRGRKRKIDIKEEVLYEEENEKKKIEDTETVPIDVKPPLSTDNMEKPTIVKNVGKKSTGTITMSGDIVLSDPEIFTCENSKDNTSNDKLNDIPAEYVSNAVAADHSYVPEDQAELLRCTVCQTDYRSLRGIKAHLMSVHNIQEGQNFNCNLCAMKFLRYKDMIKHRSNHGHACEFCDEVFLTSEKLNAHVESHREKFCCVKCGAKFKKEESLKKHVPLHLMMFKIGVLLKKMSKSALKCPYCDLKCTPHALRLHINVVHLKRKDFKCDTCLKQFSTHSSLKVHYRIHLDEAPYACKDCGLTFKRRDYLQRHAINHKCDIVVFEDKNRKTYSKAFNAAEKQFSCVFCSEKTDSRASLLLHLKVHADLRKFQCVYCGVKFSCHRTKIIHERTHADPIKKNVCTTCWKKFESVEELKEHETLHVLSFKKFGCNICGALFFRQMLLENHILDVHINNLQTEIDQLNEEETKCVVIDLIEANKNDIVNEWDTDEEKEEEEREARETWKIIEPEAIEQGDATEETDTKGTYVAEEAEETSQIESEEETETVVVRIKDNGTVEIEKVQRDGEQLDLTKELDDRSLDKTEESRTCPDEKMLEENQEEQEDSDDIKEQEEKELSEKRKGDEGKMEIHEEKKCKLNDEKKEDQTEKGKTGDKKGEIQQEEKEQLEKQERKIRSKVPGKKITQKKTEHLEGKKPRERLESENQTRRSENEIEVHKEYKKAQDNKCKEEPEIIEQ